MSATPGTPCTAASSGTEVSDSTSCGDRPRQVVWISTETGANSGNTSSFWWPSRPAPKNSSPAARPATTYRNRRLQPTIQRIGACSGLGADAVLDAEQLLAADADDGGARGQPGQVDLAALDAGDADGHQRVGERSRHLVDHVAAVGLVQESR